MATTDVTSQDRERYARARARGKARAHDSSAVVNAHVRADATLGKSSGPGDWHPISEGWPFPLEPPPPRRPIRGYVESSTGIALTVVGLLGFGLAANGVVLPIMLFSGIEIDMAGTPPPVPLMIVLAVPLIAVGILIGLFARSS